VAATGDLQVQPAVGTRSRGAEHDRDEPQLVLAVGGLEHRVVEQLQQPRGVRLQPAQRLHRLPHLAGAHRGVDAFAAHVSQQERGPIGHVGAGVHVVEVTADEQLLLRRAVVRAEPHSGDARERRLQEAAPQRVRGPRLLRVHGRRGQREPGALRERAEQPVVHLEPTGGGGRVWALQEHQRTGGRPVAGKGQHHRPRAVRGAVTAGQPDQLLGRDRLRLVDDAEHGLRHRPGEGVDVRASVGRHGVAAAPEPLDGAALPGQHHDRDLGEGTGRQLDHGARRGVRVQGQAEPGTRVGEEPGSGPLGEQAVQPGLVLGDVVHLPRRPAVGERLAARGEPALRHHQIDLVRLEGEGLRHDLTDHQAREQPHRGLVRHPDDAVRVARHHAGPAAVEEALGQCEREAARTRRTLLLGGGRCRADGAAASARRCILVHEVFAVQNHLLSSPPARCP
jgi:hypothetical protein